MKGNSRVEFFNRTIFVLVLLVVAYLVEKVLGNSDTDFVLSLLPETVSVIVTITFVDWLIKRNEATKWAKVKSNASRKIHKLLGSMHSVIMYTYVLTNIEAYELLHDNSEEIGDKGVYHITKIHLVVEKFNEMSFKERMHQLPSFYWVGLRDTYRNIVNQSYSLIDLYGARLESEEIEMIQDIEGAGELMLDTLDILVRKIRYALAASQVEEQVITNPGASGGIASDFPLPMDDTDYRMMEIYTKNMYEKMMRYWPIVKGTN